MCPETINFCAVYSPISVKRKHVLKNKLNIPYSKTVSRRKNLNYPLMSKTPWCIKLNFKLLIQRCFSLMYNLRMHFNLVFRALRNLESIAWMHSNYKIKRLDIQLLGMLLSNNNKHFKQATVLQIQRTYLSVTVTVNKT